jgi:hypothetical protein
MWTEGKPVLVLATLSKTRAETVFAWCRKNWPDTASHKYNWELIETMINLDKFEYVDRVVVALAQNNTCDLTYGSYLYSFWNIFSAANLKRITVANYFKYNQSLQYLDLPISQAEVTRNNTKVIPTNVVHWDDFATCVQKQIVTDIGKKLGCINIKPSDKQIHDALDPIVRDFVFEARQHKRVIEPNYVTKEQQYKADVLKKRKEIAQRMEARAVDLTRTQDTVQSPVQTPARPSGPVPVTEKAIVPTSPAPSPMPVFRQVQPSVLHQEPTSTQTSLVANTTTITATEPCISPTGLLIEQDLRYWVVRFMERSVERRVGSTIKMLPTAQNRSEIDGTLYAKFHAYIESSYLKRRMEDDEFWRFYRCPSSANRDSKGLTWLTTWRKEVTAVVGPENVWQDNNLKYWCIKDHAYIAH